MCVCVCVGRDELPGEGRAAAVSCIAGISGMWIDCEVGVRDDGSLRIIQPALSGIV